MPSSFTPPSVVSNVYTDKVVPNEARRMLYISFNGPNTHNSFLFSSNFNIRNRISYRITHQITNGNSRIEENPIFIGWKKKLNKNVMFHRWHELKKPTAIMLFNNFFFFCSVTTSDPRLQNAINISKGKKNIEIWHPLETPITKLLLWFQWTFDERKKARFQRMRKCKINIYCFRWFFSFSMFSNISLRALCLFSPQRSSMFDCWWHDIDARRT